MGSLLLFRQAVLAALPHLHQSAGSVVTKSSTTTSSGGGGYLMNSAGSSSSGSDSNNSHPHAHHHHRPAGQSWARRKQEQQAGRYPSLTAANDGAAEEQESSPSSPSTDQGAGVVVPVGHQTRTAHGSATGLLLCLLIVLYIYLTVSFYCLFSNIIYWGFPIKTYFVVYNFILK